MRVINQTKIIRGQSFPSSQGVIIRPQITQIINSRIETSVGNTITLQGFNFSEESQVIIDTPSITVIQVVFISPIEIQVSVLTGADEGDFDVVVRNGSIDSFISSATQIFVRNAIFIDLRRANLNTLGMEITNGVVVNQDSMLGLSAAGTGQVWSRGVKFTTHSWNRADNLEFSFVFTRIGTGTYMFGIGGSNINVNNLQNQAFFRAETQLFHATQQTNFFFGGGLEANWNQDIGTTIQFLAGRFYKVKFAMSGANGTAMSIHEVSAGAIDTEINTLHEWVSTSPANDPILMPFWAANNEPDCFITAYKIL